eukprot:scaffold38730_cov53-Attheya_sp.AAC.2
MPCIERVDPCFGVLEELFGVGRACEDETVVGEDGAWGVMESVGRSDPVMQLLPVLFLATVQSAVLEGVSPKARRVVGQVLERLGPGAGWLRCRLVECRAGQRHERHVDGLDRVRVQQLPLGRHGQRQRLGRQRQRRTQRRL